MCFLWNNKGVGTSVWLGWTRRDVAHSLRNLQPDVSLLGKQACVIQHPPPPRPKASEAEARVSNSSQLREEQIIFSGEFPVLRLARDRVSMENQNTHVIPDGGNNSLST